MQGHLLHVQQITLALLACKDAGRQVGSVYVKDARLGWPWSCRAVARDVRQALACRQGIHMADPPDLLHPNVCWLLCRQGIKVADWPDLLQPALQGRIGFLDSPRDFVGAAMQTLGLSANTHPDALQRAGSSRQALKQRVHALRRQVRAGPSCMVQWVRLAIPAAFRPGCRLCACRSAAACDRRGCFAAFGSGLAPGDSSLCTAGAGVQQQGPGPRTARGGPQRGRGLVWRPCTLGCTLQQHRAGRTSLR